MKNHIFIIFILFSANLFAQTKLRGKLINSRNNTPIEYANIWLAGKNIGTTSNQNGEFSLASNSLYTNTPIKISAIGYKDTTIFSKYFTDSLKEIKLLEKSYQLSEIVVKPNKKIKKEVLNKIKVRDATIRIASNNNPRMLATFFPFDPSKENSMLKEVIIYTYKNKLDYLCNIRLYTSCDNLPCQELINKNITISAKKGQKNIHIDLSKYNLGFPESGLYICFEWLIIEQNKYKLEYTNPETNQKEVQYIYGPNLAGIIEDNPNYMLYSNGSWNKAKPLTDNFWKNNQKGKYCNAAISLIILQ
jgi:hypothetical protein